MQAVIKLALERVHIITSIIANVTTSLIAWLFYFTVLVPFSVIAKTTDDPLQRYTKTDINWLPRNPVPDDIDQARRQG